MPDKKENHSKKKSQLHPRNKHQGEYDFKALIKTNAELAPFVILTKYGKESINFSEPNAVKLLNKTLLKYYYQISNWDIPKGYLCPPIPGRADYIHHIADLLATCNNRKIPRGNKIKCLDIGVGANAVYPIIGIREYNWTFIGSDIDRVAIDNADKIVKENTVLKDQLEIRHQQSTRNTFKGIIKEGEYVDLTICNPPFHKSLEEARAGTLRKLKNLKGKKIKTARLNFGGQNRELWSEGGEEKFVGDMIRQSKEYASSCFWFSSLVSKEIHLKSIYKALRKTKAVRTETIPMGQGSKVSRIVAWTFLTDKQQKVWAKTRW